MIKPNLERAKLSWCKTNILLLQEIPGLLDIGLYRVGVDDDDDDLYTQEQIDDENKPLEPEPTLELKVTANSFHYVSFEVKSDISLSSLFLKR